MQTDRPVNLSLFKYSRWPITAVVSITHRVTGAALFFGVAFMLYALGLALASPAGFAEAADLMVTPVARFIMLGLVFVLLYHLIAGIKHLLLDMHIGDTIEGARTGSIVVVIATIAATIFVRGALW